MLVWAHQLRTVALMEAGERLNFLCGDASVTLKWKAGSFKLAMLPIITIPKVIWVGTFA